MIRSLQAIYEKGVLRPLEPLALREQQRVTVTLSEEDETDSADSAFLSYLEEQADDGVTLESVRSNLAKIHGAMSEDFRRERDERNG